MTGRHALACAHDDPHDLTSATPVELCLLTVLATLGDLIVTTPQLTADAVTAELTAVLSDVLAEHAAQLDELKAAQAAGQPVDLGKLQQIADKLRAVVPVPVPAPVAQAPAPAAPVVEQPAPAPAADPAAPAAPVEQPAPVGAEAPGSPAPVAG